MNVSDLRVPMEDRLTQCANSFASLFDIFVNATCSRTRDTPTPTNKPHQLGHHPWTQPSAKCHPDSTSSVNQTLDSQAPGRGWEKGPMLRRRGVALGFRVAPSNFAYQQTANSKRGWIWPSLVLGEKRKPSWDGVEDRFRLRFWRRLRHDAPLFPIVEPTSWCLSADITCSYVRRHSHCILQKAQCQT